MNRAVFSPKPKKIGRFSSDPTLSKQQFKMGYHDAIPVGAGYLAVSFALGITAAKAGFAPAAACLASILCNASAGEYAGFSLFASGASYTELIIMTIIANARYFLMSCSLSQKIRPETSLLQRISIGYGLTDEIFALSSMRPGYVHPAYTYGTYISALPAWAAGTLLGAAAGQLLPMAFSAALSVALYGMFLAIIMPAAKNCPFIARLIALCFLMSFAATYAPIMRHISDGSRTIILTIILSAGAALAHPLADDDHTDRPNHTEQNEDHKTHHPQEIR